MDMKKFYMESGYHRWVNTMTYEEMVKAQPQHRERLVGVFEQMSFRRLASGKQGIEVAFNNGKSVFWALEKYGPICEWSMFDFDPNVVLWAKSINRKWKIDIFEADVQSVPRPAGSYDFCFCIDVIEHLPEEVHQKMLIEIGRILRPGGWVLAFVGKGKRSGHIHLIDTEAAIKDFENAGFKLKTKLNHDFFMMEKN